MPDVMNILEPLTTYSAPSRRAVVLSEATSEPPEGSVIASALIFSPASIAGNTRRRSSMLPNFATGGAPMLCDIKLAQTPPQPLAASSSERMMRKNTSASTPPYSSGKPSPSRPAPAAFLYSARGKVSASSHSLAKGVISSRTKRRTVSRKAACSGARQGDEAEDVCMSGIAPQRDHFLVAMPISLQMMPSITSSAPPPIDPSRPSRKAREMWLSQV